MMPALFLDLGRGLERACFDYVIIEDSSMVPYRFWGSHDPYLRYAASTPKLDPAVLVPYLAQGTTHLGLMPGLSVRWSPPFLLARLVNSIDHVTEGRVGWNCVTSSNDGAAQNYGHVQQPPHDERYDLADEFADLVTKLWDAWEPDAVVLDRDAPMFADGSKVRAVNHEGKYFRCRGPLNPPRPPRGRPPTCQAGGPQRQRVGACRGEREDAARGGREHVGQDGHRLHRHDRPCGGNDAGGHGGGRRRRLPVLQHLLRPALHHGGVRRAGTRAAAPRIDTDAICPQVPQGQPLGILTGRRPQELGGLP